MRFQSIPLEDGQLLVRFTSKNRTGLVLYFTGLMEPFKLNIGTMSTLQIDDMDTSSALIEGLPEQLRAFSEKLEECQKKRPTGDVFFHGKHYDLRFTAEDKCGVMRQVAKVFFDYGINMVHLECLPAQDRGAGRKVHMVIRIDVPPESIGKMEQVRNELDAVGKVEFDEAPLLDGQFARRWTLL